MVYTLMKIFLPLRQLKCDIKYLNCISKHLLGGWECLEGAETVCNWFHERLQWPWTLFEWGSGWRLKQNTVRSGEKKFLSFRTKLLCIFLNFDIRCSGILWSSRKFHVKHHKSCCKTFYCFKLLYVYRSTSQFFFRKANIRKKMFIVWDMNSFSIRIELEGNVSEEKWKESSAWVLQLKKTWSICIANFLENRNEFFIASRSRRQFKFRLKSFFARFASGKLRIYLKVVHRYVNSNFHIVN